MYFRIGVLKNFAMFTGKHLCWGLFLINIQTSRAATLLKRDSNIEVFLWICETFKNTFFYRTNPVAASGNISWTLFPSLSLSPSLSSIWEWWMVSFRGTYWLPSACFLLFRVFRFFLFLSLFFFCFFWILLLFGFKKSLSILKIMH